MKFMRQTTDIDKASILYVIVQHFIGLNISLEEIMNDARSNYEILNFYIYITPVRDIDSETLELWRYLDFILDNEDFIKKCFEYESSKRVRLKKEKL